MRKVLGIDSYMDQVLPNEIETFLYNKNDSRINDKKTLMIAIKQLEKYCIVKEKTLKWSKKEFPVFKVITEEKNNKTLDELKEYYFKLLDYYDHTVREVSIKRLSKKQENSLDDYEYLLYLKQLRINDELSKYNTMPLEKRLKINPYLRFIMKLSRIFSFIKVVVVNSEVPDVNRPIIYVVSHVGRDDQIVFSENIKGHYTVLSGDYESLHNNAPGIISLLNGILCFDMRSKKERQEINSRVIQRLNEGDNILCSMEGVWNLSPNNIVLDLFPGMIEVALKANAIILPVGIERFNSKFFGLNVSEKYFDPCKFFLDKEISKETMNDAKEEIRQLLADAKFSMYYHENIEKKITVKRENLGDYEKYNEWFKNNVLKGWTFDYEAIKEKSFKNKQDPVQAYNFLIQKYKRLCSLMKENDDERLYHEYIKFINDLNDPTLPNEITKELEKINNQLIKKIN